MTQEIWKDVPRYEGQYQVSDQGRVRSLDRALALTRMKSGHLSVRLNRKFHYVHRIVLAAFVCGPKEYAVGVRVEARHLDGNPANNALKNLAWGTVKENRADRRRLGEKAKLSREQMAALQSDLRGGASLKNVAVKFNIDRHTAARYRDGYMYD
jgi:hypothetical protein